MKNLILHSHAFFDFSAVALGTVDLFCIDPQTGDIFISKQGIIYHKSADDHNLNIFFDFRKYYTVSKSEISSVSSPIIIGMCYNSITELLCLAIDNGDVLSIDKLGDAQCAGCVPSGLTAMEWSYDQEVIVLVTGENTVIVMTATFDPVIEVNLQEIGFGEKQFVTVGWGKKETQFHGSEGKSAATSKSIKIPSKLVNDDGKPRISWRGDGTLFAVSVLESNGERCVRVFSRDGILQYTSEVVAGLEASLAWRPSGNLIASTQRLPNKHQVAFFEKNGLRHGEFTIPFAHDEVEVYQLAWNGDSSILAIWLQHRTSLESYVQLWTTSNYHWYLKQSLQFGPNSAWCKSLPAAIGWHGNRLDIVTVSGCYAPFEWTWATVRSRGQSSEDGAYVAVIDGAQVLLSSFRSAVPPPPMCTWTALLTGRVNSLMFAPDSSNRLLAAVSDGTLALLDSDQREIPRVLSITHPIDPHQSEFKTGLLHHWLWITADNLLCCRSAGGITTEIITMEFSTADANELIMRKSCGVNGSVISLVSNGNRIVVQLSDGELFYFSLERNELEALFRLPEPCSQIELSDEHLILGLSKRNRLYLDKCEVANNVTSFVLRPPFILITTLQHRMFCMKLANLKNVKDLNVTNRIENQGNKSNGENVRAGEGVSESVRNGRRIERGARLVTIVPTDTRVVLQMPRGNLETIQPRTLCLNVSAEYLERKEYRKAFELFRKQRINLNLLCDHNFEVFLENAQLFVEEINDASWLSLFFSELLEEDLTLTTYSEYYNRTGSRLSTTSSKVSQVCQLIRSAMLTRDDSKQFLLPILASYVREGHVGEALKVAAKDSKALKFLSCLVDVDKLFDTALGLYDLELTAFVASHTQKDPKEYLPFLNKIRILVPEEYQRYVIDEHLKRYELALSHISRCEGEKHLAECLTLVKKHNLYSQALQLFPRSSDGYSHLALAYAIYLSSKKRHMEAAILYRRSGDESRALEAFVLASEWREALHSAYKLGHSSVVVQALCRDRLIPDLVNARRHVEAGQICREVLGDVEECIAVLTLGRKWDEALWTAQRASRLDMIETHIKPGMETQLRHLTDQVNASVQLFCRHKTRLNVVRSTQRLGLQQDFGDENVPDDCDLYSDRSSVSTRSQATSSGRSSSRSSKNKRKHARKLLSLKEGGAFEDLALIRALHELVTNTCALRDEVSCLCHHLLHFDRDSDASSLQRLLAEALLEMDNSKAEIWTPELTSNQAVSNFGPEATTESIVAALQSGAQQNNTSTPLLDTHLRIAPVSGHSNSWQLEIL